MVQKRPERAALVERSKMNRSPLRCPRDTEPPQVLRRLREPSIPQSPDDSADFQRNRSDPSSGPCVACAMYSPGVRVRLNVQLKVCRSDPARFHPTDPDPSYQHLCGLWTFDPLKPRAKNLENRITDMKRLLREARSVPSIYFTSLTRNSTPVSASAATPPRRFRQRRLILDDHS